MRVSHYYNHLSVRKRLFSFGVRFTGPAFCSLRCGLTEKVSPSLRATASATVSIPISIQIQFEQDCGDNRRGSRYRAARRKCPRVKCCRFATTRSARKYRRLVPCRYREMRRAGVAADINAGPLCKLEKAFELAARLSACPTGSRPRFSRQVQFPAGQWQ